MNFLLCLHEDPTSVPSLFPDRVLKFRPWSGQIGCEEEGLTFLEHSFIHLFIR